MLLQAALDFPKRAFVVFVCLVTVVPRMPFDEPFTIGGNLSSSFRKLMLGITALHFLRNIFSQIISKDMQLVFWAIEGMLLSLLSLLTPYLLRKWLSGRINVPGSRSAGLGLMPWLYAICALALAAVVLRTATGNVDLWIFKKAADALSFIPVYRTLICYNTVTTGQARYPGRGTVMSQIVMIGELYSLQAHSFDIITKILLLGGFVDAATFRKNIVVKGLYNDNLFAVYSRVLCHAILLNSLDETYHLHEQSPVARDGEESRSSSTGRHGQQARRRDPERQATTSTVIVETIDDDEMMSLTALD